MAGSTMRNSTQKQPYTVTRTSNFEIKVHNMNSDDEGENDEDKMGPEHLSAEYI